MVFNPINNAWLWTQFSRVTADMAAKLNIFYAVRLAKCLLCCSDWTMCGASFGGQYKTRSEAQELETAIVSSS